MRRTGSKTLDRAIASNTQITEAWSEGPDGYWLILAPGLRCTYSGCHAIHEWKVRDVLRALRAIGVCNCDDCHKEQQP